MNKCTHPVVDMAGQSGTCRYCKRHIIFDGNVIDYELTEAVEKAKHEQLKKLFEDNNLTPNV